MQWDEKENNYKHKENTDRESWLDVLVDKNYAMVKAEEEDRINWIKLYEVIKLVFSNK